MEPNKKKRLSRIYQKKKLTLMRYAGEKTETWREQGDKLINAKKPRKEHASQLDRRKKD